MTLTEQLRTYCKQHDISYRGTRDWLLDSFETWAEFESWTKKSPSLQDVIDRLRLDITTISHSG